MIDVAGQEERRAKPKKSYWQELSDYECHICHKPLKDPQSLAVMIGSTCRKNIQEAEGQSAEMWNDISRAELERLYDIHNIYIKRGEA